MTQGKKTDDAKKGAVSPASAFISKKNIQTVSAPLIPMTSDSLINSVGKKEDKKEDKKDEKKDDVKASSTAQIQTGPTIDDLALQQIPTQEEVLAKKSAQSKDKSTVEPAKEKDDDKKTDTLSSSRLEDIAAQQQLTQQRQGSTEYRVPAALGPQGAYQSNSQSADPASVYRPGNTSAPYSANKPQEIQRGGVVTQYDRHDVQRNFGREAADALLEEKRRQIHGDKGLFEKYDRR